VERVAALLADAGPEAVCEAVVEALTGDGLRARISRHDGELVCGEPAGSGTVAAAPIVVGGAPWGAVSVDGRLPEGIEGLLAAHAALVAAAVAADAAQATARRLAEERDALAAARERILAATDATRRRFERDLHDGAQQRLVTLGFELRLAEADLPEPARPRIARAVERVEEILAELREISRGLHPAILSEGGLRPALRALARRSPVPIRLANELDQRFDERVEVAAYSVVSEALANAAGHSGASAVDVRVELSDGRLRVAVADDGRGGAEARDGSGLTNLTDRVEALDGTLAIVSPPGGGTTITAELPLPVRPCRGT